jgi:hypothetical protein
VSPPQADGLPSPWPEEDGGPRRLQAAPGLFAGLRDDVDHVAVISREALGATMVVTGGRGDLYLMGNAFGGDTAWVELLDPDSLETVARSIDLPGGSAWPGGIVVQASGELVVVFGRHAHRLGPDLTVLASATLPRDRPYNSFVTLTDGHLVTKDFGGLLPGQDEATTPAAPPAELLVLDPATLEVVATCEIPEPSIARLSADGDTVYVVGDHSLFRLRWDGTNLVHDDAFVALYRTLEGQTHGWDAVIALGAAWFLDDGAGAERYAGTFRGIGTNTSPLHVVRVDLVTTEVRLTEVCGLPGGLVANPPLVDEGRRIVVGYDSGNGVMAAFDIAADGTLAPRWSVEQNHASHLLHDPVSGLFLSGDHHAEAFAEDLVVRDIETGEEIVRRLSGSPLQSVLFPAAGRGRSAYSVSFSTVSRLTW